MKKSPGAPPLPPPFRAQAPVRTIAARTPYRHYFSIAEHDIRVPRFDGTMSRPMNRAAFVSGDAVSVLPYDPVRDRVMVVEQFRFGPHVRGDPQPWKLEAVAGRIDAGETPEECARREAAEETGLVLGRLHKVLGYYPAPGAVAEYMVSFVAIADLDAGCTGVSGLAEEDEDIRSHVVGFEAAMAGLASGRLDTGPLAISLLWLACHREELRADA